MLSRILVFITLLVSTGFGHAYDLTVADIGIVKNLPVCVADGKPVSYIFSREEVWKRGVRIASAHNSRSGMPVIFADPIALSDAPPEFQVWVLEHECHHHQAGHLAGYAANKWQELVKEREADNAATTKLFEAGFTVDQLKTIYRIIKDEDYHKKHTAPQHQKTTISNIALDNRARHFVQYVRKLKQPQYSRRF